MLNEEARRIMFHAAEMCARTDFDMETCMGNDLRYVRSGNEFKATFGSYAYTIRPAP